MGEFTLRGRTYEVVGRPLTVDDHTTIVSGPRGGLSYIEYADWPGVQFFRSPNSRTSLLVAHDGAGFREIDDDEGRRRIALFRSRPDLAELLVACDLVGATRSAALWTLIGSYPSLQEVIPATDLAADLDFLLGD